MEPSQDWLCPKSYEYFIAQSVVLTFLVSSFVLQDSKSTVTSCCVLSRCLISINFMTHCVCCESWSESKVAVKAWKFIWHFFNGNNDVLFRHCVDGRSHTTSKLWKLTSYPHRCGSWWIQENKFQCYESLRSLSIWYCISFYIKWKTGKLWKHFFCWSG